MSQTSAERAATLALAAYTAPVRAELQRWLRQGLTLQQMAERIPTLRFRTRALAALLHHTYATALLPPADAREAEADAVLLTLDTLDALLPTRRPTDSTTAAKPHGCNQYKHAPGCTHYTGQLNQNELQHEQRHEQPTPRPAEQPARPRDLLRQGGESDRADEQGRDTGEKPGTGVQQTRPTRDEDSGGEPQGGRGVSGQWGVPEAYSRLAAQDWDSLTEEDIRDALTFQAEVTAAQLPAVFPDDKWDFDMEKRPGSDSLHAAAADDYREYVPELTPEATARTAQEWAELEPEARVGKFFTARVEDERLLLALQDLVARCLEEGVSEAEFVRRAKLMLESMPRPDGKGNYSEPARRMEEMTPEERIAYEKDVRNLDSRARLKLIYRTQSEMAAGYRVWKQSLARLDKYPAWRFVRQPGARIKRPDHVEHEDDVRLITDIPYWLARNSPDQGGFSVPYPPFGYNSWMRVDPVKRKEAEKLGLLKKGEKVTIPPEMARYDLPSAVQQSNSASMDGLPEEAQQRVIDDCREEGIELHTEEDGSTRPQPTAPPPAPMVDDDSDLLLDIAELLDDIDNMLNDDAILPKP